MAASPGRIFTRDQLLARIWGYDYVGDGRTVDVHVSWLRGKLRGRGRARLLPHRARRRLRVRAAAGMTDPRRRGRVRGAARAPRRRPPAAGRSIAAHPARRRRRRRPRRAGGRELAGMSLIAAFGSAALDAARAPGAGRRHGRDRRGRPGAPRRAAVRGRRRSAAAGASSCRSTTSPPCGASSACDATSSPTSATSCAPRWPRSSCWPRRCPSGTVDDARDDARLRGPDRARGRSPRPARRRAARPVDDRVRRDAAPARGARRPRWWSPTCVGAHRPGGGAARRAASERLEAPAIRTRGRWPTRPASARRSSTSPTTR